MAKIVTRLVTIAMKIEAVPGTPETLGASDGGLIVSELSYTPVVEQVPRNFLADDLSPFASLPGKRSGQFRFVTELKGSGAAGTAPEIDVALKACGLGVTNVPATSDTYAPISSAIPTITIGVWRKDTAGNQIRELISGAMGTVRFIGEVGQNMRAEFDFQGRFESLIDNAGPSPTLDTAAPPLLLGSVFTIGAYAAKPNSITLDMQNVITLPTDISHASGFGPAVFTSRNPRIQFDAEQVLVADHDFIGNLLAGTEAALVLGPVGSVAGNRYQFDAPKLQSTNVTEGERDGFNTWQVDGQLNRNAGDDELSLAFT